MLPQQAEHPDAGSRPGSAAHSGSRPGAWWLGAWLLLILLLTPTLVLRLGLPDWLHAMWTGMIYPFAAHFWQELAQVLPVAPTWPLLTLFLPALVLVPAWAQRRWGSARRSMMVLAICVAALSAWLLLAWGFNYARPAVLESLGVAPMAGDTAGGNQGDADSGSEAAAEDARQLLIAHLATIIAETQHAPPDPAGAIEAATAELNALLTAMGYGTVVTVAPAGTPPGWLLTFGVSGFIFPFSLGAHVDSALTPFERVVVGVHELAHVGGVADEAGATLLAALACLRSEHDYARYAAALYALAALESSQDARAALLPPAALADLAAARANAARYEHGLLTRAQGALLDTWLRWQGSTGGVADYSRGQSDLVIAWSAGLF